MKNLMKFSALIIAILIIGCSKDAKNDKLLKNGFTYNGEFFELTKAVIYNEEGSINYIQLTSRTNEENATDLSGLFFYYPGKLIQEVTLASSPQYSISINNSYTDGNFKIGDRILKDEPHNLTASNISYIIYKATSNKIRLSFTFKRYDGVEINGKYEGTYNTANSLIDIF